MKDQALAAKMDGIKVGFLSLEHFPALGSYVNVRIDDTVYPPVKGLVPASDIQAFAAMVVARCQNGTPAPQLVEAFPIEQPMTRCDGAPSQYQDTKVTHEPNKDPVR